MYLELEHKNKGLLGTEQYNKCQTEKTDKSEGTQKLSLQCNI